MKTSWQRLVALVLVAIPGCGSPPPVVPPAAAPPPPATTASATPNREPSSAASVLDEDFLRAYAETRFFSRGTPRAARLTPDGRSVLFLRSGPRDGKQSLFEMDVATGTTRELLAPEALDKGPEHLTLEERARRERMRITATGFASFDLSKDGKTALVSLSGKLYALERASGKVHPIDVGKGAAIDPRISPDGKLLAFVQDDDLHVVSVDGGGKPRALTRGGTDTKPHGLADFCASEELDRFHGFFWSPDSAAILFEEFDGSKLEKFSIADPGHPERASDVVPYPRAGHANAVLRFGIVKVASGATTWVDWERDKYPYVANVDWSSHAPPTLVVLDRLQKNEAVLLVDPASGRVREAIHEHDDAWVNVEPTTPTWLDDGSGFVWMSEREGGHRRLALVSASGGGDVTWLTPADVEAEGVMDIDTPKRTLVFEATRDAVHREILKVSFDGGPAATVASVEGGSARGSFTPDLHDEFLSFEDSLTSPRRLVVRSLDGKTAREVPSIAERPKPPNVELTTVGPDAVHVAIVRPRSFKPDGRYAVIDAAYAGPHSQVVSSSAGSYLLDQWMADATGAIVIALDAKGTPGRGRAWERAILGKLGDVPLDGHVATIQALVASHPEMDGARVGVYGWSFGGYFATLAALKRPDVFSAAAAIAPAADWRDYDTAYTERYLGLPDASAADYDAASLLTYAAAKRREGTKEPALLIMHGTADDNVYFLNSLRLADALGKAGRHFRFIPFQGQTHQIASPDALFAVYHAAADTLREGLRK